MPAQWRRLVVGLPHRLQGLFKVADEADSREGERRLGGIAATSGGDMVAPWRRARLIAVLRSAAITCGMSPARTVERSSSKVTSRIQCNLFSMCQCSRHSVSNCAGLAVVGGAR